MSIKLDTVSYSSPGSAPLRGLSLDVEKGAFVGVMGHPGSGKSALLTLMSGLARPDNGKVYIAGQEINAKGKKTDNKLARTGILTEYSRKQFFESSLEREVGLSLKGAELTKEERKERCALWLERLGFERERHQCSPLVLSEGERQRLAIATVLVREPEILILDEPFAALDGWERHQLMELLQELNQKGVTIVMSTGEAQLISQYAKRIVVMANGRIVRDDSAKSVFTDYYDLMRRNLPVPKVRECSQRLRERGVNMPANIVLYEQFIDRLKIIMWRRER